MSPTVSFYQNRFQLFKSQAEKFESQIRANGWFRVVLIIGLIASIYFGFENHLFFWITFLLLAAFIMLVRRQISLSNQKQLVLKMARLNELESNSLDYSSSEFPSGLKYSNPHHPYSNDLDLFGEKSVFQFINRCATQLGEDRLAADLMNPNYSKEQLATRLETIQELSKHLEFRQQAWAIGKKINDPTFDRELLSKVLVFKPIVPGNGVLRVVMYGMPLLALIALLFTIYNFNFFPVLLVMMVINITIAGFYSKRIGEFQQLVSSTHEVMKNYAQIFELLSRLETTTSLLTSHKKIALDAHLKLKQFAVLVNALESRMNPIAMQFGNGLFLYDFHAVAKVESWRTKFGHEVLSWLNSLGEWDALLSLATLHFNYPHFVFPEFTDSLTLEMKDAGHLLIPEKVRVSNNFELGLPSNICLVTGANMAGKSTFLRMIGVNFILGSIGSPVCACWWRMPLIQLHSGMRTTDSLQEHQSYFFAELNRLKNIVDELSGNHPMLILLDEILKGTNSTDKQLGSRELLKQLKDYNCLVVLATHDIALGDLAVTYPNQIVNTCFEGNIENDQLEFSYKLKSGVAQKANATFLMRKMGIIP
jgi:ABC-type multidrug transport system fused ATPase/permease subunit